MMPKNAKDKKTDRKELPPRELYNTISRNFSAAAKAIKAMNPNVNVEAQENRVGAETESTYSEDFFER